MQHLLLCICVNVRPRRRCSICSPLQARAPAAVEADLSGDTRAAAGELETRWEETVRSQEEVTHFYFATKFYRHAPSCSYSLSCLYVCVLKKAEPTWKRKHLHSCVVGNLRLDDVDFVILVDSSPPNIWSMSESVGKGVSTVAREISGFHEVNSDRLQSWGPLTGDLFDLMKHHESVGQAHLDRMLLSADDCDVYRNLWNKTTSLFCILCE